jgi:hypothetical protein
MADLSESQSSQAVKIAGANPSSGVETNFADVDASGNLSTKINNASGASAVNIQDGGNSITVDGTIAATQSGVWAIDSVTTADQSSSYSPDPSGYIIGTSNLQVDNSGRLETHSTITTDEGSVRDDFIGSSLTATITGTITFTNNSTAIVGTGTQFTTEIKVGAYIKKNTDSETLYVRVITIISDTQLELETPYLGTTAAGSTAVQSNWQTSITGSAIIGVSSSFITLTSGTANNNVAQITRSGDYMPYYIVGKLSISQRIANQTAIFGMCDNPVSITKCALFQFDGTSNTSVTCISSSSSAGSDMQMTTVTLPNSAVTSSNNVYYIDVSNNQISFSINGKVVAIHKDHLPGPYDNLSMVSKISNSAIVTSTTFNIDYILFANTDQIQIANDFNGEPLKVLLQGTDTTTGLPIDLKLDSSGNLIVTSLSGFGSDFTFGDITTAALTRTLVRRTTYTEQTTNGQRSIASASANDTAAGTGARTIKITYLDQTGAGPFTETLTLNGTTGVNTVATNICFIEQIEVLTAGSGGNNAGIITLYSAINKGGVIIGTINVTDNQTFWCHHYVPIGKICNITGISSGHNGTTVGSGALFTLNVKPINVSNSVETQVSDFVRLYGQTSTFARTYPSPIKVTGPARIQTYVTPETASSTIYRCAFDFFEA